MKKLLTKRDVFSSRDTISSYLRHVLCVYRQFPNVFLWKSVFKRKTGNSFI